MKQNNFTLHTLSAIFIASLMLSVIACRQKSQKPFERKSTKVSQPTDTTTTQADSVETGDSTLFTYEMAMEIVQPGYKCDEKFISSLFGDMNLPMQRAEQYISDADWGGDSPAISYCWGDNVKYEDYKFMATADRYFGVNFNFFFDESRKTGSIKRFAIITSSQQWYQRFMQAVNDNGLRLVGNVDPAIYGKKGKMYQKGAEQVYESTEEAYYYVYDYSIDGNYDIEIGFDNGVDM